MIETNRLIIKPLTYNQLLKYIKNDNSLEKDLGLINSLKIISSELKEALEINILPNVANKNLNYLYYTLWTIILKENKIMVGDLCFMGEPNELGEIEIGYGIYDEFRKNGYMTEAVNCIVSWAQNQSIIKSIIAKTYKDNIDSYSVLLRNKFVKTNEDDEFFYWQIKL